MTLFVLFGVLVLLSSSAIVRGTVDESSTGGDNGDSPDSLAFSWLPTPGTLPSTGLGQACTTLVNPTFVGSTSTPSQMVMYSGGFTPTTQQYSTTSYGAVSSSNFTSFSTSPSNNPQLGPFSLLPYDVANHGTFMAKLNRGPLGTGYWQVTWGGMSSAVATAEIIAVSASASYTLSIPYPAWSARFSFAYTSLFDVKRNVTYGYMYGGVDNYGDWLDDSWSIDITQNPVSAMITSTSPWGLARNGIAIQGFALYATAFGYQLGSCLIAAGGQDYEGNYHNDVWYSTTAGSTWTLQRSQAPWSARTQASVTTGPKGVVILYGGRQSDQVLNDVWFSRTFGNAWTSVTAANTQYAPAFPPLCATMATLSPSRNGNPVTAIIMISPTAGSQTAQTIFALQIAYS